MANILSIGAAALDVIYRLPRYPHEDEEMRAQSLRVARGGNAANTAVVLSQLSHRCTFLGALADTPETAVIEQDLGRHGVDYSGCPRLSGRPPTSSIYLSGTGRTIVHYRDLPELSAQYFDALDIADFDWIHFEGRNVPDLLKMLERTRRLRPGVPVSLELEKPRAGIENTLTYPSVLICSRAYARSYGQHDPEDFLAWQRLAAPSAIIIVAWGEAGAYGTTPDGQRLHSAAFPPAGGVVDTVGAGDTFNAGLIDALARGATPAAALAAACALAGRKCGIEGFDLGAGPAG